MESKEYCVAKYYQIYITHYQFIYKIFIFPLISLTNGISYILLSLAFYYTFHVLLYYYQLIHVVGVPKKFYVLCYSFVNEYIDS